MGTVHGRVSPPTARWQTNYHFRFRATNRSSGSDLSSNTYCGRMECRAVGGQLTRVCRQAASLVHRPQKHCDLVFARGSILGQDAKQKIDADTKLDFHEYLKDLGSSDRFFDDLESEP